MIGRVAWLAAAAVLVVGWLIVGNSWWLWLFALPTFIVTYATDWEMKW